MWRWAARWCSTWRVTRCARSAAATWRTRSRSTQPPSWVGPPASTRSGSTACITRRSRTWPTGCSNPPTARTVPWKASSPATALSLRCSAIPRSSPPTCHGRAPCSNASWRGLGAATERHSSDVLLTKEQLAADVKAGKIDTVIVAFTDMQGRLMGKRVDGEYFVESAAHGEPTEGCNYLLTVDMEMDPVPGYEMASWERGYGDFDLLPDFATLRRIPWLEA